MSDSNRPSSLPPNTKLGSAEPAGNDGAEHGPVARPPSGEGQAGDGPSPGGSADGAAVPERLPPSRATPDPLGDTANLHEQLAVGFRLAVSKARQITTSPPLSWTQALRATLTRAGRRSMTDRLLVQRADLVGLAAELRRLLDQSKPTRRGAAPEDRQQPQPSEKALRADRALAQTRRWRPEAQRWLQAVYSELAAVERKLSKRSKQHR